MTTAPPRKRLRRHELPQGVRFITFSCQHRLPLLRNTRVCELLVDAIMLARARDGFLLHAWVVMPEHVHLLIRSTTDAQSISTSLRRIKVSVAKKAIDRWRKLDAPALSRITDAQGVPRFWLKGGGFDRNVRDEAEFARTIQYIHRNPVERGLVSRPEDWPWSSIHWWLDRSITRLPCDPPAWRDGWQSWRGFM